MGHPQDQLAGSGTSHRKIVLLTRRGRGIHFFNQRDELVNVIAGFVLMCRVDELPTTAFDWLLKRGVVLLAQSMRSAGIFFLFLAN